MIDPVEIINRFTEYDPSKGEEPLPLPIPGHWFRKICALADRIAAAENERDMLRDAVSQHNREKDAYNADLEKAESDAVGWQQAFNRLVDDAASIGAELAEARSLNKIIICAFCEQEFPRQGDYIGQITAHAQECKKHPMSGVMEDNAELIIMTKKAQAERDQAKAELAALREENRWIPCAERLPDDNVAVMICLENNCIDIMYHEADRWHLDYNGIAYADDCVTHWRPLPKPPAGPEVEA